MADTGWIRPTSLTQNPGELTNGTNLLSPNSGEAVYNGNGIVERIVLDGFSFGIPEGSLITGISYRVKAKYTGTGTVPILETRLINKNFFDIHSSTQDDTLSLSSTQHVHGGDNNYLSFPFPLVSISDVSLDLQLELSATNPSELDITFTGDNSDSTPAIKIFYDPPPGNTQSTDWIRFGNVSSHSNNWFFNTDTTVLESGNEGSLGIFETNAAGPWWFILDTPDSFGVPSDATITGIMCNFLTQVAASSTVSFQSQANISLSSFTVSNITENWFGDFDADTSVDLASLPLMTGSYNNLFGLSFNDPSDLSDLRLGFKVSQTNSTLSTALFKGEEGNGSFPENYPAPAIKIFYTAPAPTGVGINSSVLSSGTITLTSGRITIQ